MRLGLVGPAAIILAGALGTSSWAEAKDSILSVSVSPAFFNPSLGQKATVLVRLAAPASVTLAVLDRDNFVIRTLAPQKASVGEAKLSWDGKDQDGVIVPDEAYSFRIEAKTAVGSEVYEPAKGFTPVTENVTSGSYSRVDGVLSYRLSRPARVHVQAGQVVDEPVEGSPSGPVLRTIVDRQPRIAGAIVERWNGFDESGTIYIADLKGFRISVAPQSLPENSLITTGNRAMAFVDYARTHRSAKDQKPRNLAPAGHEHHQGLNVFEDHCPDLIVSYGAKAPKSADRLPVGSPLTLNVRMAPDRAPYFFSQPATLLVFVDERPVSVIPTNQNPIDITIASKDLQEGEHRIALNWASAFGPVAVWARRLAVGSATDREGRRP